MLTELNLGGGTGGQGTPVYTARNGVVVTSSVANYKNSNYYYMEYMFNGSIPTSNDPNSYFMSNGGTSVNLDFDLSAIIDKLNSIDQLIMYPRTRDDTISDYTIFISDDKLNWTEAVSRVVNTYNNISYGESRAHRIEARAKYIRVQLFWKGSWGASINEIKIIADVADDYRDTYLGGRYPSPADYGWKRYESTSLYLSYKYNNTSGGIKYNAGEIKFAFTGTQLRLIYDYNGGNNGDVVFIDGIAYPTTKKTGSPSATLVFEITGLANTLHEVVIQTYTGTDWFSQFRAVEINEEGFMRFPYGMQLLTPEAGWKRFNDNQASYPNGYSTYSATSVITNMQGGSSSVLTRTASSMKGKLDRIQFAFYGTKLRLLACTYPDRQKSLNLWVDGQKSATFTSNYNTANIGQVVVCEVSSLSRSIHQVEIEIDEFAENGQFFFDGMDLDSDGYIVGTTGASLPLPEIGWRRLDEQGNLAAFKFKGTWTKASSATLGYFGGSIMQTKEIGASVEFNFLGTKLRILDFLNNTRSNDLRIVLDGVEERVSAFTSGVRPSAILYENIGLAYGLHSVKLYLPNTSANASTYDLLGIDAIDIDKDGRLLHIDEVLTTGELVIGSKIRCFYDADANEMGSFGKLGEETRGLLPVVATNTPSGDFYLITVGFDVHGRAILMSDRAIQSGQSWEYFNNQSAVFGLSLGPQKLATIPILTSYTADDDTCTITASDEAYVGSQQAWRAFNRKSSNAERWISANPGPSWIQIEYSRPRVIKHYSLLSPTYKAANPKDWTFEASHDGLYWDILDKKSYVADVTVKTYFSINNETEYKYYRLFVTATNGYTGYYCSIDELQLYEEDISLIGALTRFPTGGSTSTDIGNEWDDYIINSDLSGKIVPADDNVWNFNATYSMTANTFSSAATRVIRGNTYTNTGANTVTPNYTGYRPMFLVYPTAAEDNMLISHISVPHKSQLDSSIFVYSDFIDFGKCYGSDNIVLPMTSATSNGYNVTASSNWAGYDPWKAFSGTIAANADRWAMAQGNVVGWLKIDYKEWISLSGYAITAFTTIASEVSQAPKNWTFEGSTDNVNWKVLDIVTGEAGWTAGEKRNFSIKNEVEGEQYRYYRIFITANNGQTISSICSMELFADVNCLADQRKTSLTVPNRNHLMSTITVRPYGRMIAHVDVAPVYLNERPSSLQVKFVNQLTSFLRVSPSGRMRAVVDVVPPPKVEVSLSTIKDAFVRANVPRLNYGEEQEMLVGNTLNGDEFLSLIQFDLSSIPANHKITKAYLKLFIDQSSLKGTTISMYEVQEEWGEFAVTWASIPQYEAKIAEISANNSKEFLEVDVLSLFQHWYKGEKSNKGLILKADERLPDVYARFATRERGDLYSPKLVVEYYNPIVGSNGYAEIKAAITAQQNKIKDIKTLLTIKSTWDKTELRGTFKVFNPDMLETSLSVSRDCMRTQLTVKRNENDGISSTVVIRNKRDSVVASVISISRDSVTGSVIVRQEKSSGLEAWFQVRRTDDSDLLSVISVNNPEIFGGISIFEKSLISGEITVIKRTDSDLESLILVRQSDYKDIHSLVNVWSSSSLISGITVKSGYLASGIIIPFAKVSDFRSTIIISEKYASDLNSSIFVSMDEDGSYAFIM